MLLENCAYDRMLTLRQLEIGHRRHALTAPLSLSLAAGQMVVLMGRNGVGKSTLLRSLCGLLPVMGGAVEWNGCSIDQLSRRELAKTVSVVLTDRPDTGMLSVGDVVEMGRMPYTPATGRLAAADKEAVKRALALCGLQDLVRRVLTTLSDGERQRVMIAKALAQQTPAILLDEPTAFLDYVARDEVFGLLRRLAETERKLIIVSTHDLESARRYGHRMLELTPDGLKEQPLKA